MILLYNFFLVDIAAWLTCRLAIFLKHNLSTKLQPSNWTRSSCRCIMCHSRRKGDMPGPLVSPTFAQIPVGDTLVQMCVHLSMIGISSPIVNWSWIIILSLIDILFISDVLSRVDMMFFLRRRCSKFLLDFFWALSSVPLIHRLSACARFTRWSISQAPWMK